MSENQDLLKQGAPMWLNTFGHILGYGTNSFARNNHEYWSRNYRRPLIIGKNYTCDYEIIARCITESDSQTGVPVFNLEPYLFAGHPGWAWILRDVGQAHWNDPKRSCSGTIYGYGKISDEGELICCKKNFKTKYEYPGYMELVQGPFDCTIMRYILACDTYAANKVDPCYINSGWKTTDD